MKEKNKNEYNAEMTINEYLSFLQIEYDYECKSKAFRSLHPQKDIIEAITLRRKPSSMKKRAAFLRG